MTPKYLATNRIQSWTKHFMSTGFHNFLDANSDGHRQPCVTVQWQFASADNKKLIV